MAPYSRGLWQEDEHQRFLEALKRYPRGPWAEIAHCVGTRSPRQVQTHAQKYYEKIERHVRGLQRDRRGGIRPTGSDRTMSRPSSGSVTREHEIDQEILEACSRALEMGERLPTPARPRRTHSSTRPGRSKSRSSEDVRQKQKEEIFEDADDAQEEDDDEDDEDEEDDEQTGTEDLLPLDKSLDFLIELLAGLDDHEHAAHACWPAMDPVNSREISSTARFA